LIEYLDESDTLVGSTLETMTDAQPDEMHNNYRGEKRRYEHVTGFHWHKAFHVGKPEIQQAFVESNR